MSDIADNEPKVYSDLLLNMIEASGTIVKDTKLTMGQKFSYLELVSELSCTLSGKIIKNIRKDNLK